MQQNFKLTGRTFETRVDEIQLSSGCEAKCRNRDIPAQDLAKTFQDSVLTSFRNPETIIIKK